MLRDHDKNREPISIHALREEGDLGGQSAPIMQGLFLSTPSARRATTTIRAKKAADAFLSTPSARRATKNREPERDRLEISIHALREEGDHRSPHGHGLCDGISIHALREEGDKECKIMDNIKVLFLSTPSARRATRRQ